MTLLYHRILKFKKVKQQIDFKYLVVITHHLLNFYLKKPYSKIYCDNVLIAEVSLKKVFDLDGYNLILEFTNENEKEQNEICLVCFLIYSIETNLW